MPTKQKETKLPRGPFKESDISATFLREVAEELDIGVPIWGWEISTGGRLIIHLAYGGEAYWPPDALTERHKEQLKAVGQNVSRDDVPVLGEDYDWSQRKAEPLPEIPSGAEFKDLLKPQLQRLAQAHGFRLIRPKPFLKVEYQIVLDRRRAELASAGELEGDDG